MRAVLKDALLPVSFWEFLKLALPGGIMMQVLRPPNPSRWATNGICCAGGCWLQGVIFLLFLKAAGAYADRGEQL
jgi:hypothetical protein